MVFFSVSLKSINITFDNRKILKNSLGNNSFMYNMVFSDSVVITCQFRGRCMMCPGLIIGQVRK